MTIEKIGKWAFILGVVIAVVAGLASGAMTTFWAGVVTVALVLIGLVVGFLNISEKEVNNFLIAAIAIALLRSAGLEGIPIIGDPYLFKMVLNVSAFVAPAALVVALKSVYTLARKPS